MFLEELAEKDRELKKLLAYKIINFTEYNEIVSNLGGNEKEKNRNYFIKKIRNVLLLVLVVSLLLLLGFLLDPVSSDTESFDGSDKHMYAANKIGNITKEEDEYYKFDSKLMEEYREIELEYKKIDDLIYSGERVGEYVDQIKESKKFFSHKKKMLDITNDSRMIEYIASLIYMCEYAESMCDSFLLYEKSSDDAYTSDARSISNKYSSMKNVFITNRVRLLKKAGYSDVYIKKMYNNI